MKNARNLLSLVFMGIVMVTIANEKVSGCIDDVVLLEKRNPGYYEYLSKSSVYYVNKEALEKPNNNLLTNVMQTTNFGDNGFEILTHEDGSFTFTGAYTGENPMYIYPMEIKNLKSGDYILSDGEASIKNGIQMRMFGVKTLPDGTQEYGDCIQLPGEGVFHWDKNAYDRAVIDVEIYPGFTAEDLRFYPMLCDASRGEEPYQNALRKVSVLSDDQNQDDYMKYLEIQLNKQSLNRLDKKDWWILCNEAKYQQHVNWLSIDFGDGTGAQICENGPDEIAYGEIDTCGIVRNKLNY